MGHFSSVTAGCALGCAHITGAPASSVKSCIILPYKNVCSIIGIALAANQFNEQNRTEQAKPHLLSQPRNKCNKRANPLTEKANVIIARNIYLFLYMKAF